MQHSASVSPAIPMDGPGALGVKEASGLPKKGPSASSRPGTIHGRFVAWLDRGGKYFMVLAWVAILVVGIVGVARVFPSLKLSIDPVPGDANDVARTAMNSAFPGLPKRYPTSVIIYYPDGVTQVANSSAARAVAAAAAAVAPTYISAGLLTADSGTSYFTYADAGLLSVAEDIYLSNSGASCLVLFTTTEGQVLSTRSAAFLKDLNAAVDNAISRYGTGGIKAHVSGFLQISTDSSNGILMDVAVTDCITVSLSFMLLGGALRSFRLIGVAFISLVAAFGFAFALVWPLTTSMNVPNFTTSLVLSTLISMSLDYCLFLLTHFKASLAKGVPYVAAVEGMLRSSGHIILVSGATLASCFLVLGTQPLSIVRSPGIATTFAVIGCVLSNLTLTPSLLLIGERWFAVKPGDVPPLSRWPRLQTRVQAASDWVDAFTVAWWRRVAQVTRTHKYSITVGLLALLIAPFAPQLPHFLPLSTQTENIAPRGTISIQLNRYLENNYSPSAVTPAKLLGVANPGLPAGGGALTPTFFASVGAAVNATLAVSSGYVKASEVTGLAWSGTSTANAAAVASAVASVAQCPATSITACVAACPAQACALRMQTAATLSSDANAMILQLVVEQTINDDAGVTWTTGVNNALAAVNAANSGATWYLYVDPGPATVRYVGQKFGQLVGITACVVVFIIAVSFRSVAMALRAVVTLCAMEVAVFGSATAIYCRGYLGEGGALETFKGDYGLFWLMPILAFSLMTGLGLDYDVFIIESICEEREAGWGDADAISVGLQRSGPVITWAGAIMCVAYGGYLFADIPLLNQLGMFIVMSVALDSFVVRPFLVPAIMHILGPANYWPRHTLPATKGPLGADEAVPGADLDPAWELNPVWEVSGADVEVAPAK